MQAAGWKVNSDGKSWSRSESKVRIFPEFSPDRKVTKVTGGALLNEQGEKLVSFGQSSAAVEKALGTPDEWKKPDHPPGAGDPPASNQMFYRRLQLVVDNDPRESSVDHVTLGDSTD